MPLSFAVSIRLYHAALASAPAGLPEISQFLRPTTRGRIAQAHPLSRQPFVES